MYPPETITYHINNFNMHLVSDNQHWICLTFLYPYTVQYNILILQIIYSRYATINPLNLACRTYNTSLLQLSPVDNATYETI